MLDQLRRDIQTRLDELLADVDKLRRALTALTSRDGASASETTGNSTSPPSPRRARSARASSTASGKPPRSRRSAKPQSATAAAAPKPEDSQTTTPRKGASAGPARTAPGATKTAVLAALANGSAMTASEVADATALGRASVSTTLSKLAKAGQVTKAARGYQIIGQTSPDTPVAAVSATDTQPVT